MHSIGNGEHVIGELHAGTYDIVVASPSEFGVIGEVVWAQPERRSIAVAIADRSQLSGGRVVTASGAPVSGCVVCPLDTDLTTQLPHLAATTDEFGSFLFVRPEHEERTGIFLNVFDARGESGVADRTDAVPTNWGDLDTRILVSARAEVVIRVHGDDGSPVSRARVEATTRNAFGAVHRASTTDTTGVARIPSMPTGLARICVDAGARWCSEWTSVDVGSDGDAALTVTLRRGAFLTGTISPLNSMQSPPVASIRSWPARDPHHEQEQSKVTAEFGGLRPANPVRRLSSEATADEADFSLMLDPHRAHVVRIEVHGYQPWQQVVRPRNGAFAPVDVFLRPFATYRVAVNPPSYRSWFSHYAEGEPSPRDGDNDFVMVRVERENGRRLRSRATPSSEGLLEFPGLTPGRWLLRIEDPLHRSRLLRTVDIHEPGTISGEPLDLGDYQPIPIRGRLRTGSPRVVARSLKFRAADGGWLEAAIAADGSVDSHLPRGRYTMAVGVVDEHGERLTCRVPGELDVVADKPPVLDIEIALRHRRVEVREHDSRVAIPGLDLSIDSERATGVYRRFETDAQGQADIYPAPLTDFELSYYDVAGRRWRKLGAVAASAGDLVVLHRFE
jgi:hypothetical protein